MKPLIFALICLVFKPINTKAQEFRGGDISFEHLPGTYNFIISFDLYFKDTVTPNQYEFISTSFSDGLPPDTLQVNEILDLGNDIKLYRYQKEHAFIAPGICVVTINNEFFLNDIVNLSEPINFIVYSVIVLDYFVMNSNNHYANFENYQTDYTIENGIFRHQLISNDVEAPVNFRYERNYYQNFDIYSLPEATNSISLDSYTGEFIWNKPVQVGKYLLAFELIEQQGISHRQRFMIVEIKESDLVTDTKDGATEKSWTTVSPNPATDLLHLQLGGFHAPVQVRIFDALGRQVYETQADAASQVETLRIPLAAWPPGVYSVQLTSGGKVLTRQVAVQR